LTRHRQDIDHQFVDLHQELQLLLQSEQATLSRITSLDDRIDRMRDTMDDMTRWSRRIEKTMHIVQSHMVTITPGVQRTQDQVSSLTQKCDMMITQQGSLTRRYEAQAVQRELSRFQDLLDGANVDQSIMCDELRRLNTRLDQLSEPFYTRTSSGADIGESESTEFRCLLFSYKYQRTRLAVPQRKEPKIAHPEEAVWLDVHIPSWFVRDQWAVSVTRATRGWQYTFRMYRILPNTATIFSLCMKGDLDGVRASLLQSGTSIYDQSVSGHNLLHVSSIDREFVLSDIQIC
jgi:hypothetical protein